MKSESTRPRTPYESETNLRRYGREIGQTKLLTIDEEKELGRRIRKGDKDAVEHMVKANLRLVVKIARDYEGRGLPLLDLINEGNIGLMKAAERFDPTKGAKVSTYASWWIKQGIKRALSDQSRTIKIPVEVSDKILRMKRVIDLLHDMLGQEPTNEEIGTEMGITSTEVEKLLRYSQQPVRLSSPLCNDADATSLEEHIPDDNAATPFGELIQRDNAKLIHKLLKKLDEREAAILRSRFGLDGKGEKTLEEVGKKFKVTRERIRQIQNAALVKLLNLIKQIELQ